MFHETRERALEEIGEFCATHGISPRKFGEMFAGDTKFVTRMRDGWNTGIARLEDIEIKANEWAAGQTHEDAEARRAMAQVWDAQFGRSRPYLQDAA